MGNLPDWYPLKWSEIRADAKLFRPKAMTVPQVDITHSFEISAAHRLESSALSPEENARTYGPCYTDHGHNYQIEVTVRGAVASETGMVMNLADLAAIVREELWVPMDHKHLNRDVPFLQGIIPTAENLAVVCWQRIEPRLAEYSGCALREVIVVESRANRVSYRGPNS